jgi:hypothetical protein
VRGARRRQGRRSVCLSARAASAAVASLPPASAPGPHTAPLREESQCPIPVGRTMASSDGRPVVHSHGDSPSSPCPPSVMQVSRALSNQLACECAGFTGHRGDKEAANSKPKNGSSSLAKCSHWTPSAYATVLARSLCRVPRRQWSLAGMDWPPAVDLAANTCLKHASWKSSHATVSSRLRGFSLHAAAEAPIVHSDNRILFAATTRGCSWAHSAFLSLPVVFAPDLSLTYPLEPTMSAPAAAGPVFKEGSSVRRTRTRSDTAGTEGSGMPPLRAQDGALAVAAREGLLPRLQPFPAHDSLPAVHCWASFA